MRISTTRAPIAMRKNRRKFAPCPRGPAGAPGWATDADRDGEGEGFADGLEGAAVGVSPTTIGVETGTDGEGAGEA
jgi:hypothetical protein